MNKKEHEKLNYEMPPGLTTEQQLRRMEFLKEFEAGRNPFDIMTCDELIFLFAAKPKKLFIFLPRFLGKIIEIWIVLLRVYIRKRIHGEQENGN